MVVLVLGTLVTLYRAIFVWSRLERLDWLFKGQDFTDTVIPEVVFD